MGGVILRIIDIAIYVVAGASLLTILVLLIRKVRTVSAIDTSMVPKHQQEEVRQELQSKRLLRKFERVGGAIADKMRPVTSVISSSARSSIQRLVSLERQVAVKIAKSSSNKRKKIQKMMPALAQEADAAKSQEDYKQAEQKYIEMISLNPKSVEAYKMLGDLYIEMKEFQSAKDTYSYIVKLEKEASQHASAEDVAKVNTALATSHSDLSLAMFSLDDVVGAAQELEEALRLEPHNPKYLDTLIGYYIALKNPEKAAEVLNKFKEVNPENQGLVEFEEQIKELKKS